MRRQHYAYVAGLLVIVLFALAAPVSADELTRKPCLCQPSIRPMDGVAATVFTASVRYQDANREAPARIEVVFGDSTYPLSLAKGRPHDGVYRARFKLPEGEHSHYFQVEDVHGQTERFPRYGAKVGPWVGGLKRYHRQTMLSRGGVYFEQGSDNEIHTFTVHYRDRDDCRPPRSVSVLVDGIRHEMKLHKGTTTNGTYLASMTLPAGLHGYYFEARDKEGVCVSHPLHGFLRGPVVEETPNTLPTLSDNRIIPPTAGHRTRFSYSVHYKDPDRDPPSVALIYVNDTPHELKLASGKSYEGLYVYRTRHHIGWDHDYYFYFEDGRGGTRRFPEKGAFHGPIVTQR